MINVLRTLLPCGASRHTDPSPPRRDASGDPQLLEIRNAPSERSAGVPVVAASPDPLARYTLDDDHAVILAGLLRFSRRALDPDYALRLTASEQGALDDFFRHRTALLRAVRAAPVPAPRHSRHCIDLADCRGTADVLRQLLARSRGLVLAEPNAGRAAKQLLIQNIAVIRALGVDTLYLDQFQVELHQRDLDTLHRTGTASPALRRFIAELDSRHLTDARGGNTYAAVVDAVSRAGVRIQALDLMASAHLQGAEDEDDLPLADRGSVRVQVFAHVAAKRIAHDQRMRATLPRPRPWLALIGNGYAGVFNGLVGVAPRLGVPSLRVEDADASTGERVRAGFDPGRTLQPGPLVGPGELQCDYLLKVPRAGGGGLRDTPEPCTAEQAQAARQRRAAVAGCAQALTRIGTYRLVEVTPGDHVLVHRAHDRRLVAQHIVHLDGGGVRLQAAEAPPPAHWPDLDQAFPDLDGLRRALAVHLEEVPRGATRL